MNQEIERKYRIVNILDVRKKIIEIGGISQGANHLVDTYFLVPQEIPLTHYLRLRQKEDDIRMVLAYHQVKNNDVTLEWETGVEEGNIVREIIEKLGFSIDVIVDKKRETFKLGETEILVDEIKSLGFFLEIESSSIKKIEAIVKELNLNQDNLIAGVGYPDLLRDIME
jgi:predicted adenylyl cyclase CyaB